MRKKSVVPKTKPAVSSMQQRFDQALHRSRAVLLTAEQKQQTMAHANRMLPTQWHDLTPSQRIRFPFGRVLAHYDQLHALVSMVTGGKLRNKHVLHLAASTGVYARFLQQVYGAKAIPMDVNLNALMEAKQRGTRYTVAGNAVRQPVKTFVPRKSGLLVPVERTNHLPVRSKSVDLVVSDHFLFANYNQHEHFGGIEPQPQSMQTSWDTLTELNRVLKQGGHVVVGRAHLNELVELEKFTKGYRRSGFVVEYALTEDGVPAKKGNRPRLFVLKKVADLRRYP